MRQAAPLQITARPEWRGKTETFIAVVLHPHSEITLSNNTRKFSIAFPARGPRIVDLRLEILEREIYRPRSNNSGEQLVVPFRVTNIGNVTSPETSVEIVVVASRSGKWITLGEFLGAHPVPTLAADASFPGAMTIRAPQNGFGRIPDLVGIVDPRRTIGDANRPNNSWPFPVPFWTPGGGGSASSGGAPARSEDGFPIGTIIVIAALVALVIWIVRKRNEAPQSASAAVRAEAHPDGGTQSIHLESEAVVLPDVRLRPVLDAGVQWMVFESADAKE